MRIKATLRFKNAEFIRKREIAGFPTIRALAHTLEIHEGTVGRWERLQDYPKKLDHIMALEKLLNCDYEEIFPPEIIGAIKKKIGQPVERTIDVRSLPEFSRGEYLLPDPAQAYEIKELAEIVSEKALECLTKRERRILELRFGLTTAYKGIAGFELTYKEIGGMLKITTERVRQIEARALAKLKYKSYRVKNEYKPEKKKRPKVELIEYWSWYDPPTNCGACGEELKPVDREFYKYFMREICDRFNDTDRYKMCRICKRVYKLNIQGIEPKETVDTLA